MKKQENIIGAFALGLLALSLSGCEFKIGNTASMPSDAEIQALVKKTVPDFADAVEKGDFTSFHSTVPVTFRRQRLRRN